MKYFNLLINKYINRIVLRFRLKECGNNFRLGYSSELLNPQFFSIANDFFTGPYCYFVTNKNNLVKIGNYVMFGPSCKILGGNHDYSFKKNHMYFNDEIDHMHSSIIIEDGAWIGSNTVILSNANIGEGSVIGAMSLVNSFIPPYCIAVGIPAKKFTKRFKDKSELIETLQNVNSKLTFEDINKIYKGYNLEY